MLTRFLIYSPTLYVGEHNHGLYALSSLVDKNTITISTGHTQPLLLEGPAAETATQSENLKYESYTNVHYKLNDVNFRVAAPYLLLGHYKVPEMLTTWSPKLPNLNLMSEREPQNSGIKLINGQVHTESQKDVENETNLKSNSISVAVQNEELFEGMVFRPDLWYKKLNTWLHQQENTALKLALIVLVGLVITMFWYLRYQVIDTFTLIF
jgi:serine/threonine-protein kinase/endoribonuclease IRE1